MQKKGLKLNLCQRCGRLKGKELFRLIFLRGRTNRIGEKLYSLNTWPLLAFSLSRYSWKTTQSGPSVGWTLFSVNRTRGEATRLPSAEEGSRPERYCVQANENLSQLNTHKDKEGNLVFFLKYSPMESRLGIILQGYICSHLGYGRAVYCSHYGRY